MQTVNQQRAELEEVERKSLRSAMVEDRVRYCTFVNMLTPVVKQEVEVMYELGHLQVSTNNIQFNLNELTDSFLARLQIHCLTAQHEINYYTNRKLLPKCLNTQFFYLFNFAFAGSNANRIKCHQRSNCPTSSVRRADSRIKNVVELLSRLAERLQFAGCRFEFFRIAEKFCVLD